MKWLADHKSAALGFAVSTAYWPGLLSAAFTPRWGVIAIGIALVSTLDPRNVPEHIRWVLSFLIALGAVSLLGSPDPRAGTLELIYIVLLCGVFLLGASLERLDGLMTGAGWGLVASSAIAAAEWFGWVPWFLWGQQGPAGLFHNSEVFAEFAALVFVWALFTQRWVFAVAGAIAIAACQSRVAILASMVGAAYVLCPRSWTRAAAWAVLLAAVAAAMLVYMGAGKASSADHRIILWGATIMSITLAGKGLGWFQASYPYETFAHSDVLQALAEMGVGAAALVVIPITILWRKRGSNAERAVFVAACVECAVSFPLHFPASGFIAAVVAGYLVSIRPVVCMGDRVSGIEDGVGLHRGYATELTGFADSGRRGSPLPARPRAARQAALYPPADQHDPHGRWA